MLDKTDGTEYYAITLILKNIEPSYAVIQEIRINSAPYDHYDGASVFWANGRVAVAKLLNILYLGLPKSNSIWGSRCGAV